MHFNQVLNENQLFEIQTILYIFTLENLRVIKRLYNHREFATLIKNNF